MRFPSSDFLLRWASAASFIVFLLMLGGAIGSIQTVYWMADEVQARFDCVPHLEN